MPPPARGESDNAALTRLVREQHDSLVRAIMGVTGRHRHDAEDVLSVVILRVLVNGVTTEPECWFRYIRDAARNEASNARRAERRRELRETIARLPGPDPHADAITARIVLLDVMHAVDDLPEVERQIIRLHYFEDRAYEEIAASLGLTASSVDKRMRQARGRLRRVMSARATDELYSAMLIALAGSIAARMAELARRADSVAPSAVTIAGVTALSLVVVMAVPAPPASRAQEVHRQLAVAPSARPGGHIATAPDRPQSSGRRAGDPGQVAAIPPARANAPRVGTRSPLQVLPSIPGPDACAGPVCVGDQPPGDRITVRRVPDRASGQAVTPLCWAVPDNPEIECRSDDPDAYVVPRPTGPPQQDHHRPAGKSSPFAPEDREPPRGTEQ